MPDLDAVSAFLEPSHRELAGRIAAFCRSEIESLGEPADDSASRVQAREVLGLLGTGGWLTAIQEQDLRSLVLVRETLGATSPLADAVFALQALGTTPILLAGTDDAKSRWLPGAFAGTAMAAFAMTEPDAGSDIASLQTTAVRDGETYVLTGTKTLISNAGVADFYTVFASTDPARGRDGISCFVVPADSEGLEFVKPLVLSSPHPLGEISFNHCHVATNALVGEEGEGFRLGLATLDRLRATVAAAACGMAERALHEALAHATTRKQFGQPLSDFQLVRAKLADMTTELTAARLLTYRAAWASDNAAERVTLEAAMAKSFATEAAQRVVDSAVQILGGRGVLADHPVDRLYRSIRALRIYEGTTEIQQLVVAGRLIKAFEAAHAATADSTAHS